MGTWGTGLFDSDDAADWSGELDEADDPLAHALAALRRASTAEDYLEAPEAMEAVAAAAWLASGLPGGPRVDESYGPTTPPPDADEVPVADALAALERVLGDKSELVELWDEAAPEDRDAFLGQVRALASTLRSAG